MESEEEVQISQENGQCKPGIAPSRRSVYKGVYKCGKKFKAQIQIERIQHYLGLYDTEAEAAIAYDNHARIILGSRARTNFAYNYKPMVQDAVAESISAAVISAHNSIPAPTGEENLTLSGKKKRGYAGLNARILWEPTVANEPVAKQQRWERNEYVRLSGLSKVATEAALHNGSDGSSLPVTINGRLRISEYTVVEEDKDVSGKPKSPLHQLAEAASAAASPVESALPHPSTVEVPSSSTSSAARIVGPQQRATTAAAAQTSAIAAWRAAQQHLHQRASAVSSGTQAGHPALAPSNARASANLKSYQSAEAVLPSSFAHPAWRGVSGSAPPAEYREYSPYLQSSLPMRTQYHPAMQFDPSSVALAMSLGYPSLLPPQYTQASPPSQLPWDPLPAAELGSASRPVLGAAPRDNAFTVSNVTGSSASARPAGGALKGTYWAGVLYFDPAQRAQVWKGSFVENENMAIKPAPALFANSPNLFTYVSVVPEEGKDAQRGNADGSGAAVVFPQSGLMVGGYQTVDRVSGEVVNYQEKEFFVQFQAVGDARAAKQYSVFGRGTGEQGSFSVSGVYSTLSCVLELQRFYS